MKAAIHLGPNYVSNSEIYKNTAFEDFESVFNITQKLVMEHSEEILHLKCLECSSLSWTRSVLPMIKGSNGHSSYQGAVVTMEKQFNSSGKKSKDFHNCLFFKKSNKTSRNGSSQRSSQTGSSSYQCSMTLSGTRMMRIVFRMPKKSRTTQ